MYNFHTILCVKMPWSYLSNTQSTKIEITGRDWCTIFDIAFRSVILQNRNSVIRNYVIGNQYYGFVLSLDTRDSNAYVSRAKRTRCYAETSTFPSQTF